MRITSKLVTAAVFAIGAALGIAVSISECRRQPTVGRSWYQRVLAGQNGTVLSSAQQDPALFGDAPAGSHAATGGLDNAVDGVPFEAHSSVTANRRRQLD
jgi:hypothetical protein